MIQSDLVSHASLKLSRPRRDSIGKKKRILGHEKYSVWNYLSPLSRFTYLDSCNLALLRSATCLSISRRTSTARSALEYQLPWHSRSVPETRPPSSLSPPMVSNITRLSLRAFWCLLPSWCLPSAL